MSSQGSVNEGYRWPDPFFTTGISSRGSVNGDYMRVDLKSSSINQISPLSSQGSVNLISTSSLSPLLAVSPIRQRPLGGLWLCSSDPQTLVVSPSLADRIIHSGDPSLALDGSPWPLFFRIAGVPDTDPRAICINTLLHARKKMPVQPGVLNPKSVGEAFCRQYYELYKNGRVMLRGLYAEDSVLSFQGVEYVGARDITFLLECLPEGWEPLIRPIDCCRCGSSDNVNVQVTGFMRTKSDWKLSGPAVCLLSPVMESTQSYFMFCQSFHLVKNLEGNYYVANEIFRTT